MLKREEIEQQIGDANNLTPSIGTNPERLIVALLLDCRDILLDMQKTLNR